VRHTPHERLSGRRPTLPSSSACLRQRSRSPPGPELSDLVTSRLPRGDASDRGERRPGAIWPDEHALGDKAELLLIRLLLRKR
jgi:hypothetical protein